MKTKVLFALIVLLFGTQALFSQGVKYEEHMADFKTKLALDEQSWEKFSDIYKDKHQKMKEVHDSEVRGPEKREQMVSIREATDEKLKQLLSDEKYELYLSIREEHRKEMKGNRKGTPPCRK